MAMRKADSLIESTIETLDNGINQTQAEDGVGLVQTWLAVVEREASMGGMANELQELLSQLGEHKPNTKRIAQLVKKLGDETAKAAKKADEAYQGTLKDLADSLKDFAKELK